MCDFKDAKVGDRVWHAMWGWGTIDDIRHDNKKPIFVQFPTHREEFRTDGTLYSSDIYSVLFWDEVKIVPPPKPKRKVKKVIEGWANVWPWPVDTPCRASIGFLHSTVTGALKERGTHSLASGDPIFIRHEYEEFED